MAVGAGSAGATAGAAAFCCAACCWAISCAIIACCSSAVIGRITPSLWVTSCRSEFSIDSKSAKASVLYSFSGSRCA